MKISKLFVFVLVTVSLGLSGCANTIRGAGKDVKETGRAVESL